MKSQIRNLKKLEKELKGIRFFKILLLAFLLNITSSSFSQRISNVCIIDSSRKMTSKEKSIFLHKLWNDMRLDNKWYSALDVDDKRKILFNKQISEEEFASNKLNLLYIIVASFDITIIVSDFVKIKNSFGKILYDKKYVYYTKKRIEVNNINNVDIDKINKILKKIKHYSIKTKTKRIEYLVEKISHEIQFEIFIPNFLLLPTATG